MNVPLVMNLPDPASHTRSLCRRCGYADPDVCLIGCSCLLHTVSCSFRIVVVATKEIFVFFSVLGQFQILIGSFDV